MKKLLVGILAVATIGVFAQARVNAASGTLFTSKIIPLTVVVTPSPPPVGYLPPQTPSIDNDFSFASLLARANWASQMAYEPFAVQDAIAQTTPQGSTKVQFTVKVDPTSKNLHVVPGNTTMYAGYGANTFACVYQVYASYTGYPWTVSDWVQGSNQTGGTANSGFPTYNYPAASLLQWEAEGVTTSFVAYSNSGSPGQIAFSGAKSTSKTVCFDISLDVPNNVPAGTYQTAIQYNLLVTL